MYNGQLVHVFCLQITCTCTFGQFRYNVEGVSFEGYNPLIVLPFSTVEEAFALADKICSAYPRIESNIDSFHLENYPKFDMEVFKNEH